MGTLKIRGLIWTFSVFLVTNIAPAFALYDQSLGGTELLGEHYQVGVLHL